MVKTLTFTALSALLLLGAPTFAQDAGAASEGKSCSSVKGCENCKHEHCGDNCKCEKKCDCGSDCGCSHNKKAKKKG